MFGNEINILVTGSKGQLGSYLVDYFRKKSFYKDSRIGKVFGIDIEDLDIRDANKVANFFKKDRDIKPIDINYVVHCAAATNTSSIEKSPEKYYAVNCLGTKNIAESCAENDIKMVFISTDYVLSENSQFVNGNFQEFPMNQYGLQKLIAEQFVKDAYKDNQKDYMVLRSSWMFGNSDNSFVEKFLHNAFAMYASQKDNLPTGKTIEVKAVDDAYGRPTPVWFIADTLECLMLNNMHGTMDLQYPWPQISRYDWATMIWNAFLSEDTDMDKDTQSLIRDLKDKVRVVLAKSSQLGIEMHHPNAVGGVFHSVSSEDIAQYKHDTVMYVKQNWLKYISMAKEILREKA